MADENKGNSGLGLGLGSAIGSVVGTGLGMATAGWEDRRQREQAKKLQEIEMKGSKEMSKFNQGMAIDTWKKTGPVGQRKQLQDAGLNVGLMYQGSGPGGATSAPGSISGQSAAASQGIAGMGMQMGLQGIQMQLAKAQKENIEADTAAKKVDTAKKAGVDTEEATARISAIKTNIDSVLAETANKQVQGELLKIQKLLAEGTLPTNIDTAKATLEKLKTDTSLTARQRDLLNDTYNMLIESKGLEVAGQKIGLQKTSQEIENLITSNAQMKQNTRNLEQDEINKLLKNAMEADGIQPTDNMVVRMLQRWLGENDVSMESVARKMNKIGAWLRGQNGSQTWERLSEIMRE